MLLDEESVTEERFQEFLTDCQQLVEDKTVFSKKPHSFRQNQQPSCKFCSNLLYDCKFLNRTQILVHILTPSHCENMKNKASESDLQYWSNYLMKMKEPEPVKVEKEYIDKKYEKAKQMRQKQNAKNAVAGKPTNNPPIPLLDAMRGVNVLSEKEYQKKYANLAFEAVAVIPNETVNQPQICTCYHCPNTPSFKTQWEVIQHIFNWTHATHIQHTGDRASFAYYENLFETLEQKPMNRVPQSNVIPDSSEDPKTPESIPTDPLQNQNPLGIQKTACLLPLFASNHSWRAPTDTVCIGPAIDQIMIVEKFEDQSQSPFFETQTFCGTCHVDMSNWSKITVIRHAFSVEHLNQFQMVGGRFMAEDFRWWMTKLSLEFQNEQSLRLGGFRPIPNSSHGSNFEGFSAWHQKELENLDDLKLALVNSELLGKFAACVYCNKWLVSARKVLRHYTSEQHFLMVRKRHPVCQAEVDLIMEYVQKCQKNTK